MATPNLSVTKLGTFEPFDLQVARGQITFHRAFCQFGINLDVGATNETIWTVGGAYSFPTSASVIKVSSSSADDTSAGTGARTILVEGLDANYGVISEIVSLNGQTAVNTTNSYLRINKMTVLTAGSGGTSAGFIYAGTGTVTAGVPAVVVNGSGMSSNESESAFYTVPAGYSAYITRWTMSSANTTATASTRFTLRVRPIGGVFGYKALYNVPGNGIYECEAAFPLPLPEKSDLEVVALANSGTSSVSTQLQILLVKTDGSLT